MTPDPVGRRDVTGSGTADQSVVRAAGGVLWRPSGRGVEVCLVHRPRYDDWSLPKGKLEPGEHPLTAAVREVVEETGFQASPQVRLPTTRYRRGARLKVVYYWSMRAGPAERQVDDEVDAVRWLAVCDAVGLVSYPHDALVLEAFAALPPVATVLGLVQPGPLGQPGGRSAPEDTRPLDAEELARSRAMAAPLALIRPARLVSAPVRRCVQTLEPLAEALGLPVEVDGRLDGPAPGQSPRDAASATTACLLEHGRSGTAAVLCGQDGVVPEALRQLDRSRPDRSTDQGTGWLLAFTADRFITATRL